MARSDMDTCSPVESRRSISRSGGLSLSAAARPTSSSVVLPMADTTATTSWPACFFAISFFATIWMRSGLATDVPPNLHTISDMRFLFRTGFRLSATIANNLVTTAPNDGYEVVFSQRTYGRAGDIGPSGYALSVCGIAGSEEATQARSASRRLSRRDPPEGAAALAYLEETIDCRFHSAFPLPGCAHCGAPLFPSRAPTARRPPVQAHGRPEPNRHMRKKPQPSQ